MQPEWIVKRFDVLEHTQPRVRRLFSARSSSSVAWSPAWCGRRLGVPVAQALLADVDGIGPALGRVGVQVIEVRTMREFINKPSIRCPFQVRPA